MLNPLSKLLTLVVAFSGTSAFADQVNSNVDPEKFGYCVAKKATEKYTLAEINRRLAIDEDEEKKTVIKEASAGGPAYFFEYMASIGLVDSRNNDFPGRYSEIELYNLFGYYNLKFGLNESAVSRSDYLLHKKTSAARQPPRRFDRKAYSYKRIQLHFLANPVVTWLLDQPDESVSHWALLDFTTERMGGDVLTALALIREIFYEESTYLNSLVQSYPKFKFSRAKVALLGRKMKPLFSLASDKNRNYDKVGTNYHFWHYFTLKSRERGHYGLPYAISLIESYTFKGGFRGDISRHSDKLGLDAAWYFQIWLQRIALGSKSLPRCGRD